MYFFSSLKITNTSSLVHTIEIFELVYRLGNHNTFSKKQQR